MRIYRNSIERITIIFTNNDEDRNKAFQYCLDNDYNLIRSGPKPIGSHEYDMEKVKIVAERKVQPGDALNLTVPCASAGEVDDIRLWVVGKMVKYPEWELQGVFTSEELAIDACVGKDDGLGWFIGPVRLNERISDTPKEWPGAYYPFPGVIRMEPK